MEREKLEKALPYIFFAAWLLCVCSVDSMLDDWRACFATVTALITMVMVAVVIGGGQNEKR